MSDRLSVEDLKGSKLDSKLDFLAAVASALIELEYGEDANMPHSSSHSNEWSICEKEFHAPLPKKRRTENCRRPRVMENCPPLIVANSKKSVVDDMDNEDWVNCIMANNKSIRQVDEDDSIEARLSSLPEEFQRRIINKCGGSRPNKLFCIIEKDLTKTDTSKNHSRLSLPCNQIKGFDFLEDDQITLLRRGGSFKVRFIRKPRKDLPLIEAVLTFGQWDLHKDKKDTRKRSSQYMLIGGWRRIITADKLKPKTRIQVWAFRDSENSLCLALVKLSRRN